MSNQKEPYFVYILKSKFGNAWFGVLALGIIGFIFPPLLCFLVPIIFFYGAKKLFFPTAEVPVHAKVSTYDIHRIDDLLEFALTKKGRLTAAEVSARFDVSIEKAADRLEECVIQGDAQLLVSESGVKVYRFHQVISDDEKNSAEAV